MAAGHNWGPLEVTADALQLRRWVDGQAGAPILEIPFTKVGQVYNPTRTELALEMAGGDDSVMEEIRFYLPTKRADVRGEGVEEEEEDDEIRGEDEVEKKVPSGAERLAKALRSRVVEDVAAQPVARLENVLSLVPRLRWDIDLFPTALRIRAKLRSFMVPYEDISCVFLLPARDGAHRWIVFTLNKALRDGNQMRSHLIVEFDEDLMMTEEDPFIVSLTEEELAELNAKRLVPEIKQKMSGPVFQTFVYLLKALSGVKTIGPARQFRAAATTDEENPVKCISCAHRARQGYLFPLEKSFFFLPAPSVYIWNEEILKVRFGVFQATSKLFEMTFHCRESEYLLSGIEREEYQNLVKWFDSKNIRMDNKREDALKLDMQEASSEDDDFEEPDDSSSDDPDAEETGKNKKASKKTKKEKKGKKEKKDKKDKKKKDKKDKKEKKAKKEKKKDKDDAPQKDEQPADPVDEDGAKEEAAEAAPTTPPAATPEAPAMDVDPPAPAEAGAMEE